MARVTIKTSSYNEKRYGKPWIAKVTFESASNAHYAWGEWCGTPGYSGLLEIDVAPGDIVARGQKDFRKPRNSAPDFYIYRGTERPAGDGDSDNWVEFSDKHYFEPVSKPEAYQHQQNQ